MAFYQQQPFSQYDQWKPVLGSAIELQPLQQQYQQRKVKYKPAIFMREQNLGYEALTESIHKKKSFRQRYLGGLKLSLRSFAFIAGLVLAINLLWFAWAKKKYGITSGYGTIHRGDCRVAKNLNKWLHLLINILSTLLLMGSNAFMQVFSGPTREELDRAHQKRRWLHIGALSFRNLRGVAKRKAFFCLILASSSIPFHLLYNSLVFASLSANEYYWAVVTDDFLLGASFNLTSPESMVLVEELDPELTPAYLDMQRSSENYERLEAASCIQEYSNIFLSNRRHLILVSSDKGPNSILSHDDANLQTAERVNFWMCSKDSGGGPFDKCDPSAYLADPKAWKVFNHPVKYCLSERTQESCAVQFSYNIMIVVIAFNIIKLAVMLFVLFRLDAEKILVTIGDAVSSFLLNEDKTTQGMCLANKREIDIFWKAQGVARRYDQAPGHWGRAASKNRWFSFTFLLFIALLTILILLGWGLTVLKGKGINTSLPGLWKLGFGTLNAKAFVLVEGNSPVTAMAMLANSPQVALALLYVTFNGLLTSMFAADDWSNFAFRGQYLMVSTPSGQQRGTWCLGLPIYYGMALLVLQTLLHWLISQSIFVVQIAVIAKNGVLKTSGQLSNCGYSPIAIVFTVIAGLVMMISASVLGLRKSRARGPPLVSTCSAAISAACHPRTVWEEMPYMKLRWAGAGSPENGIGHCSIVSQEAWDAGQAGSPMHGAFYTG